MFNGISSLHPEPIRNGTSIWEIFFRDTSFLDHWYNSGTTFVILGPDMLNIVRRRRPAHLRDDENAIFILAAFDFPELSDYSWQLFKESLKPHSYDAGRYEVQLAASKVSLNIHQLIYKSCHNTIFHANPERLFCTYEITGDSYWEITTTSAAVYKEKLPPEESSPRGPLDKCDGQYTVKIKWIGQPARQRKKIYIEPICWANMLD